MSHALTTERPRSFGPVKEAGLAFGLGALLTLLVRRPQDLSTTVPGDAGDPVLLAWILAWPAHALTVGRSVWDANTFAPLPNALAFSDPLLGYLPFGLLGAGPGDALVRYNLVLLFTYALAFAGVWVLVRQLGLSKGAALVAATAFAFNPWRAAMASHLQVLSSGGAPLALAMLARGHGVGVVSGLRTVRPGWALAGWLVATWHFSISPAVGLPLAYLLAVCTAVAGGRAVLARTRGGAPWPGTRLLAADGAGLVAFLGFGALLAQPYLQAVQDHPQARRSVEDVALYSPELKGLVTAPPSSWLWGRPTEALREGVVAFNEEALFPGLVVIVLALAGLAAGRWSARRRVLLAGTVVVVAVCALGTEGPAGGRLGYLLLYDHLPGWQGIRTPGRMITTAWLGLALLAAHGVDVLRHVTAARARSREAALSGALLVSIGLTAVVLVEGLDTHALAPVQVQPPVSLTDLTPPVMVLPSEADRDYRVMLWSTEGFPQVVNGSSGFTPNLQEELRTAASQLPDPAALERLRAAGVASLVLLTPELPGTRYELLDPATLALLPGVIVEPRGDVVVIRLDGAS